VVVVAVVKLDQKAEEGIEDKEGSTIFV